MSSKSSLATTALLSILKKQDVKNKNVEKQVRWGVDENTTYPTEAGGLSPKTVASPEQVVRRAGVDTEQSVGDRTPQTTVILNRDEQKMLEQLKFNRAKASETAKRAEEAATQARATTRTPTTIQHRREAPVVNEPSPLENFATQSGKVMGGVAESAQVAGQNIQQVVGQNIESLFKIFSPSGPPAQAEAPRVDGPDKKNANTKSFQTQSQGPRPEGFSWQQRVTPDQGGGRGGGRG